METPNTNQRYDILEAMKNVNTKWEKLREEYKRKFKGSEFIRQNDHFRKQLTSLNERFKKIGTRYNVVQVTGTMNGRQKNGISPVIRFEMYFTDISADEGLEMAKYIIGDKYIAGTSIPLSTGRIITLN